MLPTSCEDRRHLIIRSCIQHWFLNRNAGLVKGKYYLSHMFFRTCSRQHLFTKQILEWEGDTELLTVKPRQGRYGPLLTGWLNSFPSPSLPRMLSLAGPP